MVGAIDAAVGPVKQRDRGLGAGELLTGIAAAQLAGEDFLTGLDRQRADAAGQQLAPVPGLSSTTAAGLARRITPAQWQTVETGLAVATERMVALLPAPRAAALTSGPVTIDLDATDVEVYGSKKRGVAYNHQGQRVGRPHVACWAEAEIVLAADLGSGTDDPRATAPGLLRRALACLPAAARASGQVTLRADAGYFAGALARAARDEGIAFAIGAKRIAPLWRLLGGIAEDDWHDATGMRGAQVAVAQYCPDWWPAATRLLVRRVRLDPGQVSADSRSRRRRTLHPAQRALPFPELAKASAIYAYSFILTNLDVSAPVPEGDDRLAGVDPGASREGGELRGDAGDDVGVEVGQPLEAREPGFGDAAGAAAAGPVVDLGGQDLGEVSQVGVPFPDGDLGEAGGVGADGWQFQLAGSRADRGHRGSVGDAGHRAPPVSRAS